VKATRVIQRIMWELVIPLTIFVIYYMSVNPTAVVYVRHFTKVMRWHARAYWLYFTGPKWMAELLQVRGRLPHLKPRGK